MYETKLANHVEGRQAWEGVPSKGGYYPIPVFTHIVADSSHMVDLAWRG
jgi:hypothetical protein